MNRTSLLAVGMALVFCSATTTAAVRQSPTPVEKPSLELAYVSHAGYYGGAYDYVSAGVYITDLEGGRTGAIIPPREGANFSPEGVALSTDGRLAAVWGHPRDPLNHLLHYSQAEVRIVGSDGRGMHVALTTSASVKGHRWIDAMTWTRNGEQVVFSLNSPQESRARRRALWVVNAVGDPDPRILPGTFGLTDPAINPRTGMMVAVKGRRLIQVIGAQQVPLGGRPHGWRPAFSIDGSHLGYVDHGLKIAGADGSGPQRLDAASQAYSFTLGPDGRTYFVQRPDPVVLYSVPDASGFPLTPVDVIGEEPYSPSVAFRPRNLRLPQLPPRLRLPKRLPAPPRPPQRPVSDLSQVDWENYRAPAPTCVSHRPTALYNGAGWMPFRHGFPGNPVIFDITSKPYAGVGITGRVGYGESTDGVRVAAVRYACHNNGGTAGGFLGSSIALYTLEHGSPHLVTVLRRGHPERCRGATYLPAPHFVRGAIVVTVSRFSHHCNDSERVRIHMELSKLLDHPPRVWALPTPASAARRHPTQ